MMPAVRRTRLYVACLSLTVASAHAATNSCSDPYWADTLRCRSHPASTPQPPATPPATPAQLREFTRVLMNDDPTLRCVDGTRPVFYIDPAETGPSNRWLVTLTGGGSCNARDLDGNGSYEDGQLCVDTYAEPTEADEMGTANAAAMRTFGPGTSSGILSPSLADNPVFAGFNRIRIQKCSYDRYMGRATHAVSATAPGGGAPFNYTLFQHGQRIVIEALRMLGGNGTTGLSYLTWIDDGGVVAQQTVTLPSIAQAEQVVFAGHSGAAHGLYHTADRYADALRAMPGFTGDVRVVHDAQFLTMPENEAAFDTASPAGLFAQDYVGVSTTLGAYDASEFLRAPMSGNGWLIAQYRSWFELPTDSWNTLFDASCVNSHAGHGDEWKCADRFHVHLHHQTTPALIREDYSDPNSEHTANGTGHLAMWGPWSAWPHCATLGFTPCPPLIPSGPGSPLEQRLQHQAIAYRQDRATGSELATGADPSGAVPTTYLWMPDCRTHEGLYDEVQFPKSRIMRGGEWWSLRTFAEAFVNAPGTGASRVVSHGLDGFASECGEPLLTDSFE